MEKPHIPQQVIDGKQPEQPQQAPMLPRLHATLVERPVRICGQVHQVVDKLQDEFASPKSLPFPLDGRLNGQGGKQPVVRSRVTQNLQQARVTAVMGRTVGQMGQIHAIHPDLDLLGGVGGRRDGSEVMLTRAEVRGAAAGHPKALSVGESGGGGGANLRIQRRSHLPLQEPPKRRQSRAQPEERVDPEAQEPHTHGGCRLVR
mmetsp:Transcript_23875/g.54357  ORF Transcript_23875/g.54357 Transcript_23875/m.54357 type:complete len:203 (-) Transcript_23875:475-1083(-)